MNSFGGPRGPPASVEAAELYHGGRAVPGAGGAGVGSRAGAGSGATSATATSKLLHSGSRSSRDAREHCERFYADFGQGNATRAGGFQQRMFHDIPECQALYEAERAQRGR